jgi:hypothetical protein
MKKVVFSIVLLFAILFTTHGLAQTTYSMVTSASQLEAGAQYILVGFDDNGQAYAMGYQKSNNRHALAIDEAGGQITVTVATNPSQQDAPYEFTLGGSVDAWTIYDPLNNGYLNAPGGGNYLRTQSELTENGRWTITDGDEGGMVPVSNGGVTQCYMRYNITSTLFACYSESSNVAAQVYFFKAGSGTQPAPEPTNYPTNFTATVNGRDVTLTWNDAIGSQLPHKYLVIGSIGNITVPTDGIPLPDSDLVKNVNYGVQSVSFSNLNSNTTYHFAIFPYTNSGAYIDYKNNGNYPTANATTEDITVLLFEDFDENLGVFMAYSVYGEQAWHQATYQGINYANMNGYANGVANANEDWLISPAINKTGFSDVFIEFSTAMKFEWMPLRVMISTNYNGQNSPNNYDWQDITSLFNYSTGDYEWVESGRISVGISSNNFYLAFVYTSNTTNAPSWEIDYVSIEALSNGVNYYTINATAHPTNGGTITGAGTYTSGSTCNLQATPNSGFAFQKWTENGSFVSADPIYSFTVTSNRSLVANFQTQPQNYNISVSANPSNGGSVSGGGTYQQGQYCSVSATANEDFDFINWTENGSVVSLEANYTFTVTGDRNLVANFQAQTQSYIITVSAEPNNCGSVTGGGSYDEGSTCTITATPCENYIFEKWTKDGTTVSINPAYVFVVTGNASYIAHFRQSANQYTVTAIAVPANGGTVRGGGTYEHGETCTLSATANNGYSFMNWTDSNGNQVSTEDNYSFTVTGNVSYRANFSQNVNTYNITAVANPSNGGTIFGTGTYENGALCTLTATASSGFSFVNWSENGEIVSTEANYTFTVNCERSFVAEFSQGLFYTISASAGAGGTISPEGDVMVLPGEDKTFTMLPNSGCRIQRVLVDGMDVGPVESYTFRSVNENHSIRVQFSGLGVDDNVSLDLKVYPNPANDIINVESPNMKQVLVFNLFGIQIESKDVNDDHTIISTCNLSQGTYILKVENNNGDIGYSRFVVVK